MHPSYFFVSSMTIFLFPQAVPRAGVIRDKEQTISYYFKPEAMATWGPWDGEVLELPLVNSSEMLAGLESTEQRGSSYSI